MGWITFPEIKQQRFIRVKCPDCGKSRAKTLTRSYYRNGFHNEQETRSKNTESLNQEVEKLAQEGLICAKCEAVRDNEPVLSKCDGGFTVTDRATGEALGKVLRLNAYGWAKWQAVPAKGSFAKYQGKYATRYEAVGGLVKHSQEAPNA